MALVESYAEVATSAFSSLGLSLRPATASFLFTLTPVLGIVALRIYRGGLSQLESRARQYAEVGATGAWVLGGFLATSFIVIDDPVKELISSMVNGAFLAVGVGTVVWALSFADIDTDRLGLG
jgi:hypothetical protein